jgi:hypothetical protein
MSIVYPLSKNRPVLHEKMAGGCIKKLTGLRFMAILDFSRRQAKCNWLCRLFSGIESGSVRGAGKDFFE